MKTTTYCIMYRLGFTPWDNGAIPAEISDVVEGPDALPASRALDLGCGTGTQAVYLAQHSWQVTGVDAVPQRQAPDAPLPRFLKKADPAWYCLRKR